jgi:hypothetical protein
VAVAVAVALSDAQVSSTATIIAIADGAPESRGSAHEEERQEEERPHPDWMKEQRTKWNRSRDVSTACVPADGGTEGHNAGAHQLDADLSFWFYAESSLVQTALKLTALRNSIDV